MELKVMMVRWPVVFLAACLLMSCKGEARMGTAAAEITTTPNDGGWTKEQIAQLMSNPIIDIQPVSTGSRFTLQLRIKERATGQDVPLVGWIAVSKVGDSAFACKLQSTDYVPLSAWKYSEVPSGFTKTGCGPLTAGEYDIYAVGLGPRGTARMRIDENGNVTRLPWYGEEGGGKRR